MFNTKDLMKFVVRKKLSNEAANKACASLAEHLNKVTEVTFVSTLEASSKGPATVSFTTPAGFVNMNSSGSVYLKGKQYPKAMSLGHCNAKGEIKLNSDFKKLIG